MELVRLRLRPEFLHNPLIQIVIDRKAKEEWLENLIEMRAVKLSDDLMKILTANRKKDQIKLLRGQELTSAQFGSFLLRAGESYGYRYSRFKTEFLPSWAIKYKLPKVFHLDDDGKMDIVGETNLSEAQLKQLLVQRTVRISHFLDNGFRWHCFFTTYRSLRGEENHADGTPHFHYLSNFWKIDRQTVVSELKNLKHKFTTSVHIPFHRHA